MAFNKERDFFVFSKFLVFSRNFAKIKRKGRIKLATVVDELFADLQVSKGESKSELKQTSLFDSEEHRNYLEGIIARGQKAKLLAWEIENFAQYEKERFEFGSHWVLLLKAFNSTGKSNALKALEYNLTTKGIGLQLAKGFIKHGALEAKITTFWSDGLEVEYYLTRTSLSPRSTFKNGYRVYLNEDGTRKEVYNTLVDGRFVKVSDTPSFLKRYFNLAEVGGRYLNLMRGAEGLPVLEQSPASLNKMLSQAADLETAEQAIKQMTDDNKETFQQLEVVEGRIRVYSQDIVERRHLTKEVIRQLENQTHEFEQLEKGSEGILEVASDLKAMSELEGTTTIDGVDLKALKQIHSIQTKLKEFGSEVSLPLVETANLSDLATLDKISKSLTAFNEVESFGQAPSSSSTQVLEVVSTLNSAIEDLNTAPSFGLIEESRSEEVLSLLALESQFSELNTLDKQLEVEGSEKESCFKESEELLRELKTQGYPVGVCSHCGHLSITEPFEIGSTVVSPHEHN